MASLYDYGVPAMATGLTNLFNAVSQDKARQAQVNSQKIEDRVRLNALKKDAEQEERLNKYINVQGLLTSQGMHPEDAKSTIEEWKSMGWVDDGPGGLPRMQVRNAESAFKYLDVSPKWKMSVAKSGLQRAENAKEQLIQEQQEELTKDSVFGHQSKKFIEAQQKIDLLNGEISRRSNQVEKAKTLFGKTSEKNTIVPAGSTVLGPDNKPVFTAPQKPKAPTVHSFTEGDKTVNKQWNPSTNSWDTVSSGPRFKGGGGGEGGSGGSGTVKNVPVGVLDNFTQIFMGVEKAVKALDEQHDDIGREEYNNRMKALKSKYSVLLEPYKKYGLWHGWKGEQKTLQPSNGQPKTLDRKTAESFMKEAGGNADKARELAKSKGYTF